MIALVLFISIVIFFILFKFSPVPLVHYPKAAKIKDNEYRMPTPQKFLLFCDFRDKNGKKINLLNCFIGRVDGLSMEKHGLPFNALFFAHFTSDGHLAKEDDIVIVKSNRFNDEMYRLRKIKIIDKTSVTFHDDHNDRELNEIHAVVFHVVGKPKLSE